MSEWKKEPAISEKDLRETLECAHKALTEIALTKGLPPEGERARELTAQALEKIGRGVHRARGF